MASIKDLIVRFEIEPIVKLSCLRVECVHNRLTDCNLKAVTIDQGGTCVEFAQKRPKE